MHIPVDIQCNESQDRVEFINRQEVVLTCGNHASCRGLVSINGVEYNYSVHLYFVDDEWVTQSVYDQSYQDYRDIYLSRALDHNGPSDSARKKALKNIPQMLAKAIENNENINQLRQEAEIEYLSYEINQRETAIEKAQQKAYDLTEEVDTLKECRRKARAGVVDSYCTKDDR